MTREEAIKIIQTEKACVERQERKQNCNRYCESCDLCMPIEDVLEGYNIAIRALKNEQSDRVSKSVLDQIRWERDIAIEQLKDLGYELGEKPRTDGNLISRKEIVEMIDKLYDDFCNSEGGESYCIIDGNTYHSDMGYAFDGIEMFIEVFKKRLAESEKGDTE